MAARPARRCRANRTRAALVGLCLTLTVSAAGAAEDEACLLQPAGTYPVCSPEGMLAAINPRYSSSIFGNLNLAAFKDGANRDLLPGQASFSISGGLSAGGAACARHLAAAPDEGAGGGAAATPAMAAQIKKLTGQEVPTSDKLEQHVVFRVFSPNIQTWESGALGPWYAAEHSGAGGWPNNSSAMLAIELPGTRPSDLEAGGSYDARVYHDPDTGEAAISTFFTRWQGRYERFPYRGDDAAQQIAECRKAKRKTLSLLEGLGIPLDSTTGRAARERDCSQRDGGPLQSGRPYLVGRVQQARKPNLSGTVSISHITDSKVIGEFTLRGSAETIEREYVMCYAPAKKDALGCTRDGDGPANGTVEKPPIAEPETRTIAIQGRFQAPNTRSQGFVTPPLRAVTAQPDGTSSTEPLQVVSHTPRRARRNVDWEQPGIAVGFSAPVNPATVTRDSFSVSYRDEAGARQAVPGLFAGLGPSEVMFVPDDGLKDGVRYQVALTSAIEGRDGQSLAGDYGWPFYTMVDLDDDENIDTLPDIIENEEGVEPHVFQVSRDATLVPDKPTLTRVYTKWRPHDDVHSDDQVSFLEAHVRIKDSNDRLVYPVKREQIIRRPDNYTKLEIARAENTVNLFTGWRAQNPQPRQLVAEIEPVKQCGDPRTFLSEPRPVQYSNRSPVLDVDVYFFKPEFIADAYDWVRDDDPERTSRLEQLLEDSTGPRIAQQGAEFTTQNFPVVDTRMHFKGPISASQGFVPMEKGGTRRSGIFNGIQTDQLIMQSIADQLGENGGTNSDAVMVLFPGGIQSYGGYAYKTHPDTGLIGVFVDTDRAQYFEKAVNDVAHELGHVFGLSHSKRKLQGPRLEADSQGVPPIEGFRIAPGGRNGWNKSEEEGNGQVQGSTGTMMALMASGQFVPDGSFIAQSSYRRLLPVLQRASSTRFLRQGTQLAAAGDDLPATGAWRVSGALKPDGSAAAINRIVPVPTAAIDNDSKGAFRAVLLDARGNELTARAFSAPELPGWDDRDSGAARLFSLQLPAVAAPAELVIEHQGQRLAVRQRSDNAPTLELAEPVISDGEITFAWPAEDADGDALVFDVEYSRDGERFRPLALGLSQNEITLPASALYPGSAPTLRVTASDGFNRTAVTRPLEQVGGLRVLVQGPDEDSADLRPEIYAVFNAALPADVAESAEFVLTDRFDEPVEAELDYTHATRRLTLIPKEPLTRRARYTARLAGVRDTHGNTLEEPVTWTVVGGSARSLDRENP